MMAARSELPFGGCKDYCLKDTAPPLNPSGLAERPGTFRGIERKQKPGWRALALCVTSRLCLLSKVG